MNLEDPRVLFFVKLTHFSNRPSAAELKHFYADYCQRAGIEDIGVALRRGSGRVPAGQLTVKQAIDKLRDMDGQSGATSWGYIADDLANRAGPTTQRDLARWVSVVMESENLEYDRASELVASRLKSRNGELVYSTKNEIRIGALNIRKAYDTQIKNKKVRHSDSET